MKDRQALTSERQTWITRKTLEYLSNSPWLDGEAAHNLAVWSRHMEDVYDEIYHILSELDYE